MCYILGNMVITAKKLKASQIGKSVPYFLLVLGWLLFPHLAYSQIENPNQTAGQATVHKVKGDFYLQKGKVSLAIAEYQEAISLNPRYSNAYFNMAIAAYSSNNMASASSALEKLVEIDPKDAEAHYNLGCLELYRNDKEKAKRHFEQAQSSTECDARLRALIHQALAFIKEFEVADISHQEVILFLLSHGLPPVQLT